MTFFTRCLLLASVLAGLSSPASAQITLDNFEATRQIAYTYTDGVLVQNFANPAVGAGNPSSTVGRYTRSAGATYDVIQMRPQTPVKFADVSAYLAGTSTVTMKVYSPAAGIPFQLVMQDKTKAATGYPNGNLGGTFNATTTAANAWQTLTFTFAGGTSDASVQPTDIDQLVLLINAGTNTNGVYLLDDLTGPAFAASSSSGQVTLDNFQNIRLLAYTYTDGVLAQNFANPAVSAGNASSTVARYTRSAGAQYDVIQMRPQTPVKFADVSAYVAGTSSVTMKVYSPAAGIPFQLVMQDKTKAATGYPNGNLGGTFNATSSVANAWEMLTFTFTAGFSDGTVQPTDIDQLVLLINPGTNTNGVYLLDDLTGPALVLIPPAAAVTYDNFENIRLLTYAQTDGALVQNFANPAVGAGNSSSTVGRYTRNAGVQYDAILMRPQALVKFGDVSDYVAGTSSVTMKVYSPAAGIPFQLVMQDKAKAATGYPNGNLGGTFNATTTVANAWQTLTFTFAGGTSDPTVQPTDIDQLVLLINPNTNTNDVYLLDDLTGPAFSTIPLPAQVTLDNFQNIRLLAYAQTDGVLVQNFANPAVGAGNPSSTVGRYTRNAGVPYDAILMRPQTSVKFADVSAYVAGTSSVTMKVYSPAAGIPFQLVMQDKTKAGTGYPNGNFRGTFNATTTVANAWQTLTFTFAGGTSDASVQPTDIDQLVLLVNPNTNTNGVYLLDDLTGPALVVPPPAQITLDNFQNIRKLSYTQTDGVLVQNFANPAVGAGNPSTTVGRYTRNAGVTYDVIKFQSQTAVNFVDVSAYLAGTSSVSMKVYSPAAGIPFQLVMQNKLKAATGYPNGNLGGAFNATTTVANAWETLTFTFAAGTSDPTVQSDDIDQMVLLINPNTNTNGVYLLDDLMGPDFIIPPPAQVTLDNFQTVRKLSYIQTDGTLVQNFANPAVGAGNASSTVGRYTRNASVPYDVIQFQPQPLLAAKFGDVSAYLAGTSAVTMKVYSPAAGIPFQLVMQDKGKAATGYPNGNLRGTFNATTTVANAWETLTFAFTAGTSDGTVQPTDVNQMVLLINPGTNTTGVYLLDDLAGPDFAPVGDLTVSAAGQNIIGTYNDVTIMGAGVATLTGGLVVLGDLTVQSGGELVTNCQVITGPGSCTLAAGATLRICDAAGISANGATGAVQTTGGRSFSTDASYYYNGTVAQTTGTGLPNLVRNLTVTNNAGLTLTADAGVSEKLQLFNGNLTLSSHNFTLLSMASGTAMVVNSGTGVVTGAATVQRYVNGATNTVLGYRHFASPVVNASVASMGNPMYGTFSAIYRYQESLVNATIPPTATPGTTPFDLGWVSTGSAATMTPAAGYTILAPTNGAATFVGTLNNGNIPVSVTNTAGLPGITGSGWNFLGNSYPSPLDGNALMSSFPSGVDQSISVWKSLPSTLGAAASGQYITRSLNGTSTDPSINGQYLPLAQAFFVHTSANATITMTNAMRPTTYTNSIHYRPDHRSSLTLGITAQRGLPVTDNVVVLFDDQATAGFDNGYDARKLRNFGEVPSLATLQGADELAVNVMGKLVAHTSIPLTMTVSASGTFKLNATLAHLPAGTRVFLLDALTGTRQDLTQNSTYSCLLDAGTSAQRFSLVFEPAAAPLGLADLPTAAITVSPNPSHGIFRVNVPTTLIVAHATLLDYLGRTVATPVLTTATTELRLTELPVGVYTLRLETSAGAVTRRVVVE